MQPQAEQTAPDYSFITNPQQPKRPSLFNLGAGSKTLRIVVVVGGFFLLLILFIAFKNILSGSNKSIPALVNIAQDQQELIHLAQNGTQNAVSGTAKNFSQTAALSLQSEQRQLLVYLKSNGRKVSTGELSLGLSKLTDSQLTAAVSASNFDPTYTSIMKTKLTSYQQALKSAFAQTKGSKGHALLNDDYTASQLLLQQLGS